MNLGETKKYINQQLSSLGWTVQIDGSGYEKIHQHTQGKEDRVIQLYYKLVSLASKRPKREINGEVVRAAIADLARMPANLDISPAKFARSYNPEQDRLSIEQLAKALEMTAAPEMVAEQTADSPNAKSKSRGNGTQASSRKAAGSAVLPTILVVDSSPTIRGVVTRALDTNFTIIQAKDGEEAWSQLLSNNNIEMVITGLMMPRLDGFGLISRIRTDRNAHHLHSLSIIVVTTLDDANVKLRALSTGANDFITKVTETVDLQTRVLARYKLSKTLKEAERKQIASRKSKAAASSDADNSESKASKKGQASPKKAGARNGSSQEQQLTESDPVAAEVSEPVYFTADKYYRTGETASNNIDRFGSTTGMTLAATVVVVLIISGIFYFRTDSDVANDLPEVAQADASARTVVEVDTQKTPASNSAPAKPAATENTSPHTEVSQNGSRDVAAENDKPAPLGARLLIKPSQDSAPEKKFPLRSDKPVNPPEPAGETAPRTRSPNWTARAPIPAVAAPDAGKAEASPTPTSTPSGELNSGNAASATPSASPGELNTADAAAASSSNPSLTEPSQQGGTDAPSVAFTDEAELPTVVAKVVPTPVSRKITQAELTTLLKRFVFVYQAGDLEQFLNLFANDVRTNAQTSKAGLREDYERLFSTTDMRQMILGNVTWEVNDNNANGWGNFEVKVRNAGQETIKAFNGSLTFQVEKIDGRLQIKKLYHGQWRAGAG